MFKVFLISISLFLFPSAAMAVTVVRSPGTVVMSGWSDPENVKLGDNNYATSFVSADSPSTQIMTTNYGFAIPLDATVNKITVTAEARASANFDIYFNQISLYDSSGFEIGGYWLSGEEQLSTTDALANSNGSPLGGDDLWGAVWTPADVNSSNFGAVFDFFNVDFVSGRTIYLDHVYISVEYTEAAPAFIKARIGSGRLGAGRY